MNTNLISRFWSFRLLMSLSVLILVGALVPTFALIDSSKTFRVISPGSNTVVSPKDITFSWTQSSGAVKYKLQLSSLDDPDFEGPDYSLFTSNTSLTKTVWPMAYIMRVTSYDKNNKKLQRTQTISFTANKNVTSNTQPVVTTSQPSVVTTAKPVVTTSQPPVVTTAKPVVTTSQPPVVNTGGIWAPKPGTSWYWQINGKVDESVPVTMYDIDLFDAVPSARSYSVSGFGTVNVAKGDNAGVIDRLHAQKKVVICYVDTGAAEGNRPDIKLFPASVMGTVAEASDGTQWDEKWLDTRQEKWSAFAPLMWARFDLAKSIGCDGVEPDQNNHVGNQTGFPESVANDRAWYLEVAKQAHARGLSVGMKNGVEAINGDLVKAFDWHLNEECNQYDECDTLTPFIQAGKAVFNAEYPNVKGGASQSKSCATATKLGLSSMGYPLELGGGYFFDCITGTSRATGTKK